jgi:hypothetical protein
MRTGEIAKPILAGRNRWYIHGSFSLNNWCSIVVLDNTSLRVRAAESVSEKQHCGRRKMKMKHKSQNEERLRETDTKLIPCSKKFVTRQQNRFVQIICRVNFKTFGLLVGFETANKQDPKCNPDFNKVSFHGASILVASFIWTWHRATLPAAEFN